MNLQRKAQQLIDKRGGTDSLKADAEELKDIAKGPGSVGDKAKRAGEALKDPGANCSDTPASPRPPAAATPTTEPVAPPAPNPGTPPGASFRSRASSPSTRSRSPATGGSDSSSGRNVICACMPAQRR